MEKKRAIGENILLLKKTSCSGLLQKFHTDEVDEEWFVKVQQSRFDDDSPSNTSR